MEEEYSVGQVRGFQVSGKNYYSQIFPGFEEAITHKKHLEETKAIEKIVPMAVSEKPKEIKPEVKPAEKKTNAKK